MYALTREQPIPERERYEDDALWRQRVETLLAAVVAKQDAMASRISSIDKRLGVIERERELMKAKAGGAVWAVSFIVGTLVMGGLTLYHSIKSVLR